jgi:hypothetical protein
MLNAALHDEDDSVRYEALLQYQSHPKAKDIFPVDRYMTMAKRKRTK